MMELLPCVHPGLSVRAQTVLLLEGRTGRGPRPLPVSIRIGVASLEIPSVPSGWNHRPLLATRVHASFPSFITRVCSVNNGMTHV